jgi:hypothetical protein
MEQHFLTEGATEGKTFFSPFFNKQWGYGNDILHNDTRVNGTLHEDTHYNTSLLNCAQKNGIKHNDTRQNDSVPNNTYY